MKALPSTYPSLPKHCRNSYFQPALEREEGSRDSRVNILPPASQHGLDIRRTASGSLGMGAAHALDEKSLRYHPPGWLDTTLPKSLGKNTEAQAPQPGTESVWGVAWASGLSNY